MWDSNRALGSLWVDASGGRANEIFMSEAKQNIHESDRIPHPPPIEKRTPGGPFLAFAYRVTIKSSPNPGRVNEAIPRFLTAILFRVFTLEKIPSLAFSPSSLN